MNPRVIRVDPATTSLRRVGRLARRRMRIDGATLRNGTHTDGTLRVEIRGLGSPAAAVPETFTWEADRPVALVITRSGLDGEDVSFQVGPARSGVGGSSSIGDGSGIRYVAFCYDAPPAPAPSTEPFAPTPRERRSVLDLIGSPVRRRSTGGATF
jgi:hypothetical protein